MMIKRFGRIFSENSGGRSRVGIADYDQRRAFYLEGPTQLIGQRDGTEYAILEEHHLPYATPNTKTIVIDDNGRLETLSPNVPEVYGDFPPRYTLEGVKRPLLDSSPFREWPTIRYHELTEVDRLGAGIDLVQHASHPGKKLVFRYALLDSDVERLWNELLVLTSLPTHPGITTLDKVVLSDVGSRIIGVTTLFIESGGFLHTGSSRPFKLRWLQQLTDVLDFLHLKMGLIHGHLKTRNILLDLQTDSLQISGFGHAKNITAEGVQDELEQAKRLAYAFASGCRTFTGDTGHENPPRELQSTTGVPRSSAGANYDCTTTTLRKHIDTWIARRECRLVPRPMHFVNFQNLDAGIETSPTREGGDMSADSTAYSIPWQRTPYRDAFPGRTCRAYIQDCTNTATDGFRGDSDTEPGRKCPGFSSGSPGEQLHEYGHNAHGTSDDKVSTTDQDHPPNRPYADETQIHHSLSGAIGKIREDSHVSSLSGVIQSHGSPRPEVQELQDRMVLPLAPAEILAASNADQSTETELGTAHSQDIHVQPSHMTKGEGIPKITHHGSALTEVGSPDTSLRVEEPSTSQEAGMNSTTEPGDDMPADEGLAGVVDAQGATHGAGDPIQYQIASLSPTRLVVVNLASLSDEPLEGTNHGKPPNGEAETQDTTPGKGSNQEYGLLLTSGAVQTEPKCCFDSQPKTEAGLCADLFPSHTVQSPRDSNGTMPRGTMDISDAYQDVPGKQVIQNDTESSDEHLDGEGERDDEYVAVRHSDTHEQPGSPIGPEPICRLPRLQKVAVDALNHHSEHFSSEQQRRQLYNSNVTEPKRTLSVHVTQLPRETLLCSTEAEMLPPVETLVGVGESNTIYNRESSTDSLDRCQSKVEDTHLHPNPVDLALVAPPTGQGMGTTNEGALISSEEEPTMATPNPTVSHSPMLKGTAAVRCHKCSISGPKVEKITLSGRTPLPTRGVPSNTTRDKQPQRRKRLVSPDIEWTFMPERPNKKSKILDSKLGPKEKPLTPYLNSSVDVSRRRRTQSDMELDLEADIFGPELRRQAKRSKMAVTEPIRPRSRKPKQVNLRGKVVEPRIKRHGRDKADTNKSSKSRYANKAQPRKPPKSAQFITLSDSDDEPLIRRTRASRIDRLDKSETSVSGIADTGELDGDFTGDEIRPSEGLDCDISEAE